MVDMTRRVTDRALFALVLGGALALAVLVVTRGDLVEDDGQPTTVLVSGRAEVPQGQVHDDVYGLHGTVVVRGTVEDDVFLLDGRARIEGTVRGDVTVVRGDAVVTRGAEVDGALRTSEPARVSPRATVRGEIGDAGSLEVLTSVPLFVWFGAWSAAGIAVLALIAVARRPLTHAAAPAVRRPGRSIARGTVLLAGAPFLIAVLALSLLGSVLAVVLAAGAVVATAVGAGVTGVALGRLALPRREGLAPYAGWATVGAALGLALLLSPLLAALLAGGVVAFGVGALVRVPRHGPGPRSAQDHRGNDDLSDEDGDEIDWDSLVPAEPAAEVDGSEPRILAAFPLSAGTDRD